MTVKEKYNEKKNNKNKDGKEEKERKMTNHI